MYFLTFRQRAELIGKAPALLRAMLDKEVMPLLFTKGEIYCRFINDTPYRDYNYADLLMTYGYDLVSAWQELVTVELYQTDNLSVYAVFKVVNRVKLLYAAK